MSSVSGGATVQQVSISETERKAFPVRDQIALSDMELRRTFATRILWLFSVANLFVLAALALIYLNDVSLLEANQIKPENRLITSEVIMALLGATTVQLGTLIVAISAYLFPKPPKSKG